MLSTAKSANIGFQPVVQLFARRTNPATHLVQKIPFKNSFYKPHWMMTHVSVLPTITWSHRPYDAQSWLSYSCILQPQHSD